MRALLLLLLLSAHLAAAESLFRPGDVVSLVGGQDMVVVAERGELEQLLTEGLPQLHLHFRSLAHEGDTVVEQHRDLNYPSLEDQLTSTGTTVLIAHFGAMERLAGMSAEEFLPACERLLERLSGHGSRRVVLTTTFWPEAEALRKRHGWRGEDFEIRWKEWGSSYGEQGSPPPGTQYPMQMEVDKAGHFDGFGLRYFAHSIAFETPVVPAPPRNKTLTRLIREKNQLWYHYYRPQNWAFLAGDRTNQPSSRDHVDPTKRWFPEEMQKFLPLVEAKEKEIDALANAH